MDLTQLPIVSAARQAFSAPSALPRTKQAAEAGDAKQQFLLACARLGGFGPPKDFKAGTIWLQKAVAQGHPGALTLWGLVRYAGDGGPTQKAEGVGHLERAAAQGEPEAMYWLGTFKLEGASVPLDEAAGLAQIEQAANAGHAGAQLALGRLYAKGEGLPADATTARSWFKRAAGTRRPRPKATRRPPAGWAGPTTRATASRATAPRGSRRCARPPRPTTWSRASSWA